jgi:hypothetical protein
MEKPTRRVKKVAKKSHLNTGKPTEQAEKKVPAIPTSISTQWRDEEELVDYEPDDLPCFRPLRTISRSLTTAHALLYLGKRTFLHLTTNLAERRRMMHQWRGRNAAQIPQKTSCGARRLKTIRQPLSREVVSPSLFSKTTTWPTYRGPPRGEVSPHLTKTNRQPLLGRVVNKTVIPAEQDELANLPTSALEGSKSSDELDGGGL